MENIGALDVHIWILDRTSNSKSSMISEGQSLGALGRDSESPTPALELSQQGNHILITLQNSY